MKLQFGKLAPCRHGLSLHTVQWLCHLPIASQELSLSPHPVSLKGIIDTGLLKIVFESNASISSSTPKDEGCCEYFAGLGSPRTSFGF